MTQSTGSGWFEWKEEELKELGIKDFQFFDYVKGGLQPFSRYNREPIFCPYDRHKYCHQCVQYDEIETLLHRFRKVIKREKELESEKPIYLKYSDPLIDCLVDISHGEFTLKNGKMCISFWEMDILRMFKREKEEEKANLLKEMESIVKDDPDLEGLQKQLTWKYLLLPESEEECGKLKSELTTRAIFKKSAALEIKKRFDLGSRYQTFTAPEASSIPKKELRPCQKHRKECRIIATKLWEETPNITIAGMIFHDEINKACEGRVYAEKTIRNWIKDLCPNRKPGRRLKTK